MSLVCTQSRWCYTGRMAVILYMNASSRHSLVMHADQFMRYREGSLPGIIAASDVKRQQRLAQAHAVVAQQRQATASSWPSLDVLLTDLLSLGTPHTCHTVCSPLSIPAHIRWLRILSRCAACRLAHPPAHPCPLSHVCCCAPSCFIYLR